MNDLLDQLARDAGLTTNTVRVLAALAVVFATGSAAGLLGLLWPAVPPHERHRLLGSLATWWVLFALLLLAAWVGKDATVVVFARVSHLGLREFRNLARQRIAPVRLWWRLTYLAVPIHYLFLHLGAVELVRVFIPVCAFAILVVRLVIAGQTAVFLETVGVTFMGLMPTVFLFSHAVLLLALPDAASPAGARLGCSSSCWC